MARSYYAINIDGEGIMATVIVSPKYQVVIPKEIRDASGIVAGQKMQMISFRDGIQLVPVQPIESLRGTLEGIDTHIDREADRL